MQGIAKGSRMPQQSSGTVSAPALSCGRRSGRGRVVQWFGGGLLLALLFSQTACAPSSGQTAKRLFWPPPPGEPHLEYLTHYRIDKDVTEKSVTWMQRHVLGESPPVMLFKRPSAVAVTDDERLLVSDLESGQVQVLDLANGAVRSLQGLAGAQYSERPFALPVAIEYAAGQIYVGDQVTKRIFVFAADEKLQYVIKLDKVGRFTSLAVDARQNRLLVVDTDNHRLAVYDQQGNFRSYLGERGRGPLQFNFPVDVDLDADGNLYVLDAMNARVQKISPDGNFLLAFGERGTAAGSFQIPKGIAVSRSGQVLVTDSLGHRVVIFDTDGQYLMTYGGQHIVEDRIRAGGFYLPERIAASDSGLIVVVDSLNRMLQTFQLLTPEYLRRHPIVEGQAYTPGVAN